MATDIDALIRDFATWDLSPLDPYLPLLSTKKKGRPFPPYVPFVGKQYEDRRVLAYATAQALRHDHDLITVYGSNPTKAVERLYYPKEKPDFTKARQLTGCAYTDVAIRPYAEGPMLALIGMYFLFRFGDEVAALDDLHKKIAVSNYYKFSLRRSSTSDAPDLNPASRRSGREHNLQPYWDLNDRLSAHERRTLSPQIVISFRGQHISILEKEHCELVKVRDPAWLRRAPQLSPGRSYHEASRAAGRVARRLAEGYAAQCRNTYEKRGDRVVTYLLYHLVEWEKG